MQACNSTVEWDQLSVFLWFYLQCNGVVWCVVACIGSTPGEKAKACEAEPNTILRTVQYSTLCRPSPLIACPGI